ncbi:MAG TPA: tricarballylate utilization 4Fe-4S protein TcuB [Telmatospirillum sp.]|nr:tricarballylate utilization 4Fe-4S protein TcuB [Telmatospirillum sp.]
MHASESLTEADRLLTVCNSCRYCEGLCAVFPAMEMRRAFPDGDLNYLANLCHNCGSCYIDCQYAPPHEFNVNIPKVFSQVRKQSYAAYAWPGALRGLFTRNGLAVAVIAAASVAAFKYSFGDAQTGPASFYSLMSHNAMVGLFGVVFLCAIVALIKGARNFWRDIGAPEGTLFAPQSLWQAVKDVLQLRYLDGGGEGCYNAEDAPVDRRRLFHHLTFYGFLFCFAATAAGTLDYYVFHRVGAPGWSDLPVLLGTIGGLGLVAGPVGLIFAKSGRDKILIDGTSLGMDVVFLVMLTLSSLSGLALLALRDTSAMPLMLACHLGIVFALFLTLPYGKFVHGLYRFLALIRYARERRHFTGGEA